MSEPIALRRACEAVEIPSGVRRLLPSGMTVRITQALGGSYTVATEQGSLCRIDEKDADALGTAVARQSGTVQALSTEQAVWQELRTVFDPEIPVNIADLGLIYSCTIAPLNDGRNRVEIQMTLTAPGCGMSDVLKADVERKLSSLPDVAEVSVQIVFDPPWSPNLMSEAAKLQLGLDLDFSPSPSSLPLFRSQR